MSDVATPYSIITNYGCHWTCPYCIVRETSKNIPYTDTDKVLCTMEPLFSDGLVRFLSLSGGGDPCHPLSDDDAEERMRLYRRLGALCEDAGVEFEMHTSYFNGPHRADDILDGLDFSRIVFHMRPTRHSIESDLSSVRRHRRGQKIRVVYVVRPSFDEDTVNAIADIVADSDQIDELSFRQMVRPDWSVDLTLHDFLKAGHGNRWHYIEQDDYNRYVVNDRIYDRFEDIGGLLPASR